MPSCDVDWQTPRSFGCGGPTWRWRAGSLTTTSTLSTATTAAGRHLPRRTSTKRTKTTAFPPAYSSTSASLRTLDLALLATSPMRRRRRQASLPWGAVFEDGRMLCWSGVAEEGPEGLRSDAGRIDKSVRRDFDHKPSASSRMSPEHRATPAEGRAVCSLLLIIVAHFFRLTTMRRPSVFCATGRHTYPADHRSAWRDTFSR